MQERKNRFIIFDDLELKSDIVSNGNVNSEQGSNLENVNNNLNDFSSDNNVQNEQVDNLNSFSRVNQIPEQQNQQNENTVSDLNQAQNGQANNLDIFSAVNQVPKQDAVVNNVIAEDITKINQDSEGRIVFDTPVEQPIVEPVNNNLTDIHMREQQPLPVENPVLMEESKRQSDDSIFMDQPQAVIQEKKNEVIETPVVTLENANPILEEEIIEEVDIDKSDAFKNNRNLQDMINKILKIDALTPVQVHVPTAADKELEEKRQQEELARKIEAERVDNFRKEIYDVIKEDDRPIVFKSDLLDRVRKNSEEKGIFSILARYGEDYCAKTFVTNPSIGREEEIKQLILTLLTPEKSAILIGKPGIGKTSIVEGLAFRIQRGLVPEALKNFSIVNIKTPSLIGSMPNGETRLQTLVDELKQLDHVILFIDEIHMLIGATNDSAMDFANMFKEGLGRGQIKVIGATTTEEYERYILRDKAFVRRFQSIEVLEPSREHTIKILMGTLPKIEKETGAKMKYTTFIKSEIMAFIVDITSEFKRIYGIGSRYPDICLTLVKEAFSQCIFDNRDQVTIFDVRDAILNSKNIYPDVIRKEIPKFDEKFKKIIDEENAEDASIDRL